jgi:transposase
MFISTKEFAARAQLDRRSAAKILKQAAGGKAWRAHVLVVRETAAGRGGRSGAAYQVDVRSLPEHLMLTDKPDPSAGPDLLDHKAILSANAKIPGEIARRFRAVVHASQAPRGSELRRDRVAGAAVCEAVSRATIYRWLNRFEREGLAGLFANPQQTNRPALAISRAFDAAVREHHPQEVLDQISREFEADAKAAWARVESRRGATAVQRDLEVSIQACCADLGLDFRRLPCLPSLKRVNAFKKFALTQVRHHDEKRWQNQRYRIRRDYSDCLPMQVVFVDVKFCDLDVIKDGTVVRPALIGFMDAGTGRLFPHFVPLAQRQSVRKADVEEALAAMCMHPEWGVPRALYFDNGPEMWGLVDSVAAFAAHGRHILAQAGIEQIQQIRAMPYNPQAKAIEALFGRLNREVFPAFRAFSPVKIKQGEPGHKPPTQSWDSFIKDVYVLLDDYHGKASRRNPSARQRFEKHAAAFKPIVLSLPDVAAIFGSRIHRAVVQGAITVDQVRRVHAETLKQLGGKIEAVLAPNRAVFLSSENGQLTPARLDQLYSAIDPKGIDASDAGEISLLAELRAQEVEARASGENTAAIHATFRAKFRLDHRDHLRQPGFSVSTTRQPRVAVRARAEAVRQRAEWTDGQPVFSSDPPLRDDLAAILKRLAQDRAAAVMSSPADLDLPSIVGREVVANRTWLSLSLAGCGSVGSAEQAIASALAARAKMVDLFAEPIVPRSLSDLMAHLGADLPDLIAIEDCEALPPRAFERLFCSATATLGPRTALVFLGGEAMCLAPDKPDFSPTRTYARPARNAELFAWTLDHLAAEEIATLARKIGANPTEAQRIADRTERGMLIPTRKALRAELRTLRKASVKEDQE